VSVGGRNVPYRFALLIDYNYTPLLRILLQMNQSSFFEEIYGSPLILIFQKIYGSPLILTFPQQLIELFELKVAKTCKTLYECYEQFYKEKTAVVLYYPKSMYLYSTYADNIKFLQRHHDYLRFKFVSIRNSASSNCPVKIVCLNQDLDVPKRLDCLCANTLVACSFEPYSFEPCYTELNASFKMFKNLKSLSLCNVIFNNSAFSIISSLPSIEFIQLKSCKISNHLIEKCTIPKIQLVYCEFSDPVSIKLLPSLELFEISAYESYTVDVSNCFELESL
jgi:hypothetical protein